MKHIEYKWNSYDNLNIFAQSWEPETINPKAIICLIHGLGEHTSRYIHVAKAFCDAGYILFGADLRGHGLSDGQRGHFSSIEVVMKDIDILLEKANENYPDLPKILYGHSMGAVLVLYYSLKNIPDVKGVIATSPGLHNALSKQPFKVIAAKVLGSIISSLSINSGLEVKSMSRDKKVLDEVYNDPLYHFKVSLGFGKIMLNVTEWTMKHSGEFKLPLLLMHGKADRLAYPSSSIDFAKSIKENCELILWEEAYHELHNEPEKQEVLNKIINWIDILLNVHPD